MEFKILGQAVRAKFMEMAKTSLYRTAVTKDQMWETYLGSFPEGTNPIFKERTEHDCQSCKSFIRAVGSAVTIVDGKLVSIWDVEVGGFYQVVADAMSKLVKSAEIDNILLHPEPAAGVEKTRSLLEDNELRTWDHFYVALPSTVVRKGIQIGTEYGHARSTKDVFLRSLRELTVDSIETVLDLISQNSLYRGAENSFALKEFLKYKKKFDKLSTNLDRDIFAWSFGKSLPESVSRIRNTAIGTLLTDISNDVDLEDAVKLFESKVAPMNYKRPTALVTKAMIQKAQTTIEELGLSSALVRRYATIEDITVNNILFADRSAKKAMSGNVFDELSAAVPVSTKSFDKVEEVTIDAFLTKILPTADSIEVFVENRHTNNMVSLIAPDDPTSKLLFKWDNRFSWSYAGEVADSIKERVKAAGGSVTGDLRCSLSWSNYDDLDLHMKEPNGNHIYFGDRRSSTGGELDVDMNAGGSRSRTPVENITFPDRKRMREGKYNLYVNQFNARESSDVGFEVEIEFDGTTYNFSYEKAIKTGTNIAVAEFEYSHKTGLKMLTSLPSSTKSKTVWNVPTQTFRKVNVIMLSPNYWDLTPTGKYFDMPENPGVGNKHFFFMIEGCQNEEKARGFFNEFLNASLNTHRKVLEVVGNKMKTEQSDRQLSGIGFSSTQKNHLLCRVSGKFTRIIKVVF